MFNKGIAKEALSDASSHYILSGEQHTEVGYLQKHNEKYVRYQCPKKQQSVFIHMAEIFIINILLYEDLCMDIMNINLSFMQLSDLLIHFFIQTFSQLFFTIY